MYDSFLAVLSIVLVPIFFWWSFQKLSYPVKLLGFYVILFFAQGSLELSGLNLTLTRYIFELPLILYFFYDVIKNGLKKTPGGLCVLFFILSSIPSIVFTSGLMFFLFLQQYLLVWLLFYCIYHSNFSDEEYRDLNILFISLCISQMFAAVFKYLIVGICEPYIGSMSSHSGGLTTLFSLAGFVFAAIMYYSTERKSYLWGCLGFVLFGLIGDKRALAFLIPAFVFVSFIIYSIFTRKLGMSFIKKIVCGLLLIPLLFYVMVRVNPSFNPDRKVWGEFDLEYTISYAEKYNNGSLTKDKDNVGRAEAHGVLLQHLCDDGMYNFLFGYGTGLLVPSSFNNEVGGNVRTYSFNRWGIGYSMGIGFIEMLAQVGFVGTIFYFLIYLSLIRGIYIGIIHNRFFLDEESIGYSIAAFCCILVMIFLSFIYNKSAFIYSPVTAALVWFIFYAYKQLYSNVK